MQDMAKRNIDAARREKQLLLAIASLNSFGMVPLGFLIHLG